MIWNSFFWLKSQSVRKCPRHKNHPMVPNVRVHEQTWVLSFFFLPMAPCSSWSNLPRELIDRIFRRPMDSKDLARCTLVCTNWRNIIGIYMFVSRSLPFVHACLIIIDYLENYLKKKFLWIFLWQNYYWST